jgi:hypothetical protein
VGGALSTPLPTRAWAAGSYQWRQTQLNFRERWSKKRQLPPM